MCLDLPVEELIARLSQLSRQECIEYLRRFQRPPLDFTEEYLAERSVEQLRHLLLAACLQAQKHDSQSTS